jgi:hypothetical protein
VPTSPPSAIEPRLAAALSRFAVAPAGPASALDDLGLGSLSLIRVILAVLGEDDAIEIDPAGLAGLRTVADLQDWLAAISARAGGSATGEPVTA